MKWYFILSFFLLITQYNIVRAVPGPGDIYREYVWSDSIQFYGQGVEEISITLNIDDLNGAIKAELSSTHYSGHCNTGPKQFKVNSSDWIRLPVSQGTPQEPDWYFAILMGNNSAEIPLSLLNTGNNQLTFTDGGCNVWGCCGWPGYHIQLVVVRIYYDSTKLHPTGAITMPASSVTIGDNPTVSADVSPAGSSITRVDFIGYYEDYDWDGNGLFTDWQYHYPLGTQKDVKVGAGWDLYGIPVHIGTALSAPYATTWDNQWVPDQTGIKIMSRIEDSNGMFYMTEAVQNITLNHPGKTVKLYKMKPEDVPTGWWSLAGYQPGKLYITDDLTDATAARVVALNAGEGYHGLNLNGTDLALRDFQTDGICWREDISLSLIHQGENIFATAAPHSEILWPGPAIMVSFLGQTSTNTVLTPRITPNGGTFMDSVTVTITCITTGATIRYTTDGSDPTSSSTQYTAPLSLTQTTTVKAKAFKTGMEDDSNTATATFTKVTRPYHGTPATIPGKIECEDFDNGGEGIAYHDTTPGNTGGQYRTVEDVDISDDQSGGYLVSVNPQGEWLEYTVNVLQVGTYTIDVFAGATGLGGTFHIEFDGVDKTGTLQVPDTGIGGSGGCWNEQTISKTGVSLAAGEQIMRLVIDSNHSVYNDYCGCMNYINIILEGQVTPTIAVTSPNGDETWTVGMIKTVTWTSIGTVGNVNIDLSTDGGTNWIALVVGTENDGSEFITVPNIPTMSGRIRVQDVSGSPDDTSDMNFTIEPSPDPESISANITKLDFGEIEIGKTSTLDFTITNTGGGTLTGSISTDKKWIEVSPTSFEGNNVTVNVTVDNSILNKSEGEYSGTISITSDGGSVSVEVTLMATCVLVKPNPYDPSKGKLTFFGDGIVTGKTTIRIYSLSGELVSICHPRESGDPYGFPIRSGMTDDHEIQWDGKNENGEEITNGIYIYIFESPKEKGVGKFTIIIK